MVKNQREILMAISKLDSIRKSVSGFSLIYISLSSKAVIQNSFHNDILEEFKKHFENISVFCWGKESQKNQESWKIEEIDGNITYIGGNFFSWLQGLKKIEEKKKPSLIYINDFFIGGLFGVILKMRWKMPLFLRCGSPWAYDLRSPKAFAKTAIIKILKFVVLRKADKIVCNSQALAQTISKYNPLVIHNGVDLQKFHPEISRIQNALIQKKTRSSELNEPLKVLYVGNLNKEKGLEYLLTAVEQINKKSQSHLFLRNQQAGRQVREEITEEEERRERGNFARKKAERIIQLTIVGEGPLKQKYQQEFPKVLFRGKVPHQELPLIINEHDLLVHPSYVESLPNVVLEAMACAKPVIACCVWGTPEIITSEEDGYLVPPKDSEAIKVALLRCLEQRENSASQLMGIGKKAREKIGQKFDAAKQNRMLIEAVLSCLIRK